MSEHSENETAKEEVVPEEEEEFVEEEVIQVEEKPKTPDPYGYTELHTNIEHIEEYDDGFVS